MEQKKSYGLSVTSMCMGIVSLVLACFLIGIIPAILAVVFGILAIALKQSKGMAIAGIVTGVIGIMIATVIGIAVLRTESEAESRETPVVQTQQEQETEEQIIATNEEDIIPTIEEAVIYEGNDVVIKVLELEKVGIDYRVKLYIENNSALNLGFNAHAYGVNGIMSGNNIFDMDYDVAAGKKANIYLEIDPLFMNQYEIKEIRYIDLLIWAYDNDAYFKEFDTDAIRIKTSAYDEISDAPSGEELYNKSNVSVEYMGRNKNKFTYKITNNTGVLFDFDVEEICINDFTVSDLDFELMSVITLNGNSSFITISVEDEFMQDNGIAKVETIEFNIACRPLESYTEGYKIGTIKYSVE